jgi:hypothetical protein
MEHNFKNIEMNKLILICLVIISCTSCGINRQAQQLKALENCDYKVSKVNSITLAGTDIKKLISSKTINLSSLPGLALGYLRKDIPLKADLQVEISNPSSAIAAINNFDYIILVNKQELVNGTINQQINVEPGKSVTVPLQMNANIYQFLSNQAIMQDISDFLGSAATGSEKKGLLTLKIKPSIMVGGSLVKYPGYITIDKEVSSKILL